MKANIWKGNKVRLRAVEPEDWNLFYLLNQDTEMARYCDRVYFPSSKEALRKWCQETASAPPSSDEFRWVIEKVSGEAIGTLHAFDCNLRNGTFKYGLIILPLHQKQGCATEVIHLVLNYYFLELRYQKACVSIHASNLPSIQLHKKLGFQQEGILRRMLYTEGQFYDELIFGLLAEEYLPLAYFQG